MSDRPRHYLSSAEIAALSETVRVHPLNPAAIRHTRSLGDALGLQRLGVHLVRLEPGSASSEFHFHHFEEEFVYILSGRGVAHVGEEQIEVGPGDFLGFNTPSLPHTLANPFEGELVCLVGGERRDFDITDYPHVGKRLYRAHGKRHYVDWQS
ncbi:cupin domain-containing protein [Gloeobacter kilaueensis]|uniref:Cupin type-2 domain-containing protein n=1 Tax=Gloeobacter kilaueensis (strain ATCC BAA-2537 / CCAP 1431/1 / ULC 316 / JS1) TaxID=1183438 RepID=U5QCT3_GLOK1|nr:cupin domain-containing protein [Gloeobacter kilaueensis]AGY56658.1 hypothetical protein GKIL_0412 [Gloeobacter kilaueensis JS1]